MNDGATREATEISIPQYIVRLLLWIIAAIVVPSTGALVYLCYSILVELHDASAQNEKAIVVLMEDIKHQKEIEQDALARLARIEQQVGGIAAAIIAWRGEHK